MKKKLNYEEKVKKDFMIASRLKRVPPKDNRIRPIFHTCGICKKNKVKNHHFLCDKCWKEKNTKK